MTDTYTVSVYSTPLAIPFSCFVHTYIVTEHDTIKNRYDVLMPGMFARFTPYDGRIFKNILPADTGFLKLFKWSDGGSSGSRWNATRHSTCAGEVGSPAWKLYTFIESAGLRSYPYKNHYNIILGPNSNTFTQWVTDQVPECKLLLPYNAWGKSYKK